MELTKEQLNLLADEIVLHVERHPGEYFGHDYRDIALQLMQSQAVNRLNEILFNFAIQQAAKVNFNTNNSAWLVNSVFAHQCRLLIYLGMRIERLSQQQVADDQPETTWPSEI